MSTFQIVLIGVFIFVTILGVAVFAIVRSNNLGEAASVTLWGSLPASRVANLLEKVNKDHAAEFKLIYVEKDARTLRADLIEALASSAGPDLIILPHEELLAEADKFTPWSYASYPLRTYTDQFLDLARLFTRADGLLALPLYADPVVLYYDRARLRELAIVSPPSTWTQLINLTPSLLQRNARGAIEKSAIALGEFGNIPNAKDIFSLLLLQAGSRVVVLNEKGNQPLLPAVSAVNFFNQFADSARPTYSWNSGLPSASQAATAGLTAFYLGLASEWSSLRAANPHLELDAAAVPQAEASGRLTFARLYGLAIPKQSPRRAAATLAAYALTTAENDAVLAGAAGLPPARRDLLSSPSAADPLADIFYKSAVVSQAWADNNPARTKEVFRRLVEAVKVGRLKPLEAVEQANQELQFALGT